MKCTLLIKCFLLFICIESCNAENSKHNHYAVADATDTVLLQQQQSTDTFSTGKLIPNVICVADAGESYALYIPAKNTAAPLPVIYFFDPHADGAGTLKRYTTLAEHYGFILVASNNSKNGNDWPTEDDTWNSLYNDAQKRLKIDAARIYVCGFSGGAKAATWLALQHKEIVAVIACGAALPEMLQAADLSFSFTAITGQGDMNQTDLVSINNSLNNTTNRHRIIFFDGIHEWPPLETMDIAFAGLQFDAMAKKTMQPDSLFINEYISKSKNSIAGFLNTNKPEKAELECTLAINLLTGLTNNVNWFAEKDAAIKNSANYQKQSAVSRKLFLQEQGIKTIYQQQFQQGDMNYWLKTINDVMARAKAHDAAGAMYQRLKAYLSLAFYSISSQSINSNQDAAAQHFVNLYKLVDNSNSEAWYFSAILNARNKNAGLAKADLLKAISNGFNDKARLMQQAAFQQPGLAININEMIGKMK